MTLNNILYLQDFLAMKNLHKIFITIPLLLCLNISAQEPVVFHYNFSFETYSFNNVPMEDLETINIKIQNSKNYVIWKRSFSENNLPKDEFGEFLLSDTVRNIQNSKMFYSLKINYKLKLHEKDSSEFFFSYPDSVKQLALEIYFDQVFVRRMINDEDGVPRDEYETDTNPKPALIVKYLNRDQNIFLGPKWFVNGLIKRPNYVLYNNSSDDIYRINREWLTCFFGDLYIGDSNSTWVIYKFGPVCGTINCSGVIKAGKTYDIVEGYSIARKPRKLISGYYKYSVKFKDMNNQIKTIDTYFSVIYTK